MTTDLFINRHIGPRESEIPLMLNKIGVNTLDELIEETIPSNIRLKKPLKLGKALTERKYFRKTIRWAHGCRR